ncbi:WD40 repeat-like protein [Athelia psychrophila]|uniref:WD40 repeat-like protein n=1 Tax=Athelia psychrophila TaxID=1759441 RepID=A0A166PDZ8_9AGAM|nr:WD40 repeat-like protein [Fibularhizoctonia sp. CBS 109695]
MSGSVWNTTGTSGGTINNVNGNLVYGDYIEGVGSNRQELNDLLRRQLKPAEMDTSDRPLCLPGTRADILQIIRDWADDRSSTQTILWLYGLAGSGKSTIAATIAQHFRERHRLGALLTFDRGVDERRNPELVVRTVAFQIGLFDYRMAQLVSESFTHNPLLLSSPISYQYQKLLGILRSPIEEASDDSSIVLVLDALDECGTSDTRESLIKLMVADLASLSPRIRVLITSRKESDIEYIFGASPLIRHLELDLTSEVVVQDISAYLHHQMTRIRISRRTARLQDDWPGQAVIQILVTRTNGLFVWASTAAKFIDGYNPRKQLKLLLDGNSKSGAESAIDSLYRTALMSCDAWDDAGFVADFQTTLGIIIVARVPLSSPAIDDLICSALDALDDWQPCDVLVGQLGSVLTSAPHVRIIHPSFADFLTDRNRCGREEWYIHPGDHNTSLASKCLDFLSSKLTRNMCGLTLSLELPVCTLPEAVKYACLYWTDHVCSINSHHAHAIACLKNFMEKHLLHWFEAMSILKRSRDATSMLDNLHRWMKLSLGDDKLLELVKDAWRLSLLFGAYIEEHPLLVYSTAIPFSPVGSAIYATYHEPDSFPTVTVAGVPELSWSPCLLTISVNPGGGWIVVAFSPDGTRIACGSNTGWVRVWDASSGAEVAPPMRAARYSSIDSVVFSPDGTRIVSGSSRSIHVWDAASGAAIISILEGHSGRVTSLACSADGTRIVSGSSDNTIRVWDAKSGAALLPALKGKGNGIISVAFSPDDTQIISGSDNAIIQVWDADTGEEVRPALSGQSNGSTAVYSMALSPDGTRIIAGCEDGTIRMWDLILCIELPAFRGHTNTVTSVAFFPDSSQIVSGSNDFTVRVWDASAPEREPLRVLQAHVSGGVRSVAVSPDGTRIISSGGHDGAIRVWDAESALQRLPSLQADDIVLCDSIAFSPDGAQIVTGSRDDKVRVWDTRSGAEMFPALQGHHGWVCIVAFSSDGTRIASSSADGNTRLWDAVSGAEVLPALEGHFLKSVTSLAFSPDGTRIAGSYDSTIHLWDTRSGAQVPPFMKTQGRDNICAVAFSPNGTLITSISYGGRLRVWDARSGTEVFQSSPDRYEEYESIAFSPDGSEIFSRDENGKITIWDARSGIVLRTYSDASKGLWLFHPLTGRLLCKRPDHVRMSSRSWSIFANDKVTCKFAYCTHAGDIIIVTIPPSLLATSGEQ